ACVTVNVCPAIVSVPVRKLSELAAALNSTVPVPVPFGADVKVSHGTEEAAVQAHPAAVVTVTTGPGPPAASSEALVGARDAAQEPGWVAVNGCPAIVSVPGLPQTELSASVNSNGTLPGP